MDGLEIVVKLKEIYKKLEDLIQILTRKRNSFNEDVNDFLILTFFSTIKKRRILIWKGKIKDDKITRKIILDILDPKTYQLQNQEEVHKLKDNFHKWQNEEEFYYCPSCLKNWDKQKKLKSVLHPLHSKQDYESIFSWILNLLSILTWSSLYIFKTSNNSSHFFITSSSPPIFTNIHQIHPKPFNPSKSLS